MSPATAASDLEGPWSGHGGTSLPSCEGVPGRTLLAHSDPSTRSGIGTLLREQGHEVDVVADGGSVLGALADRSFDVLILDVGLPGVPALDILRTLPSLNTSVEVLVVGSQRSAECARDVLRLGAREVMCRSFDPECLLIAVERAISEVRQRRDLAVLRAADAGQRIPGLVGESPAVKRLLTLVEQVAPTPATVLITGDTGTGKELVARAIHSCSPRREGPLVTVSCSAIPPSLLEAELFGHAQGAFTGAIRSRTGLIESAHGGTLFLDEIGTVSADVQVKLLRVIEERRLQRIGSNTGRTVDFRLIAATNEDLSALVSRGRFREDLYFRLNVFPIRVPALRERRGDVILLVHHFLDLYSRKYELPPPQLTAATLARMQSYSWPGNVRELENVIERAVVMRSARDALSVELPEVRSHPALNLLHGGVESGWTLERLEREYLLAVLESNGWRRKDAAAQLGVSRRTIHRKLRRYEADGLLPDRAEAGTGE